MELWSSIKYSVGFDVFAYLRLKQCNSSSLYSDLEHWYTDVGHVMTPMSKIVAFAIICRVHINNVLEDFSVDAV
jgi:hypothetical protein